MDHIDHASESEIQELHRVIQQVWKVYYPLDEDQDVASHLGVLLYESGYYAEALGYFIRSVELYGPDATISYNMGLCHYGLRQMEAALECVNEALTLKPDFEDARAMRIRIEASLSGRL
jgi:tetratricopeptide (TPR) repeat protein